MEAKRARYTFGIKLNYRGYIRSIPDLIDFLFPTRSGLKKQGYARIFKAIRHAKNQHSDLTHLADEIIDWPCIRRCAKDLTKIGIICEDEDGYTFSDEFILNLHNMADLVESYMNSNSKQNSALRLLNTIEDHWLFSGKASSTLKRLADSIDDYQKPALEQHPIPLRNPPVKFQP